MSNLPRSGYRAGTGVVFGPFLRKTTTPRATLAAPQRGEPLVDLAELVGPAHQLVDHQAAVEIEIDQARKIEIGRHRAVHRAGERLSWSAIA